MKRVIFRLKKYDAFAMHMISVKAGALLKASDELYVVPMELLDQRTLQIRFRSNHKTEKLLETYILQMGGWKKDAGILVEDLSDGCA
jgi:hypothetical protein